MYPRPCQRALLILTSLLIDLPFGRLPPWSSRPLSFRAYPVPAVWSGPVILLLALRIICPGGLLGPSPLPEPEMIWRDPPASLRFLLVNLTGKTAPSDPLLLPDTLRKSAVYALLSSSRAQKYTHFFSPGPRIGHRHRPHLGRGRWLVLRAH